MCSWSGKIKTFWMPLTTVFSVLSFHTDLLKTDVNTKSNQDLSQTHLQILAGSDTIQSMNQTITPAKLRLAFRVALKLTDTSVRVWTMKQCQRQIYIRERQIGIEREREQEKGENLQRQYLTWPDGRYMQTNHICSYLVCLRATMLMSVCV